MVGCLGKLYESVENLNETYILQGKKKEIFLKPTALNPIASVPLSMLTDKPTHKICYSCNDCNQESNVGLPVHFRSTLRFKSSNDPFSSHQRSYSNNPISSRQYSFSDYPNTPCPTCSKIMTRILTYVAPPPNTDGSYEGGFVNDVTYMIMDDLVVKPLSTLSSITLLNQYNVKELAALQEKVVDMGMDEALKLLKASLHSINVLTTVFLNDEV